MTAATHSASAPAPGRGQVARSLLLTLVLLFIFLVGVECLSKGIKGLGGGVMDAYLGQDMNPFLALFVGILTTTLVQSSSVTTSLIVGLVGSGQLHVASAIPMVMGANIGTTVTNTIASLAHLRRSEEFRRAFAAATCHDFFNFLSVSVFLPVELICRKVWGVGLIEELAYTVSAWTSGASTGTAGTFKSPLKVALKASYKLVQHGIEALGIGGHAAAIVLAVVGVLVIFLSLGFIVRTMRALVLSRVERYVNRFLGSSGGVGLLVGVVLTVMAQSSSITTSVLSAATTSARSISIVFTIWSFYGKGKLLLDIELICDTNRACDRTISSL